MLVALVLSLCTQAQPPKMVADPNWEPVVGRKVEVTTEGAPACLDLFAFQECENASKARDAAGIEALLKTRKILRLKKGTSVLIVAAHRPEKRPNPPRRARVYTDSLDYVRSVQESASNHREEEPEDFSRQPVEVRILDGELAGQKRVIAEFYLSKLVPARTPDRITVVMWGPGGNLLPCDVAFQPPARKGRSGDAKARARSLLVQGQRAEKRLPAALRDLTDNAIEQRRAIAAVAGIYWAITKECPETSEAKQAAERLAAIGFHEDDRGRLIIRWNGLAKPRR